MDCKYDDKGDDDDFVDPPPWKSASKSPENQESKLRKRPRTREILQPALKMARAPSPDVFSVAHEVKGTESDTEGDEQEPTMDELLAYVPDVDFDQSGRFTSPNLDASSRELLSGVLREDKKLISAEDTDYDKAPLRFGECPLCGESFKLDRLEIHANACLDQNDRINQNHRKEDKFRKSKSEGSRKTLSQWLSERGLAKYETNFWLAGYTSLDKLQSIKNENILRENCGIKAIGPLRKLCTELGIEQSAALSFNTAPYVANRALLMSKCLNSETGGDSASGIGKGGTQMWKIFEKGYRAPLTTGKKPKNRFQNQDQYARAKKHPWNHRIPGTSMVIDSFRAAGTDTCKQFFISHAHGDHYQTLRRNFQHGKVLCSAVTANFLQIILRLPTSLLEVLPMNTPTDIPDAVMKGNGVTVTLFDANHCPGAVLMLFRVWSTGKFVLHTGDCRFAHSLFSSYEPLQSLAASKNLDYLFLDTTYCNPRYTFPSQSSVLSSLAKQAQAENSRTRGRCLFIFGSYTIGKEKCFLKVAEALDLKIYCDSHKRRLLKAASFGDRITSRLVTSPPAARVHVSTMGSLSTKGLRAYIRKNKLSGLLSKAGLAVVVRPTGWTFRGGNSPGLIRHVRSEDGAIVISLSYSEHSSYSELREFVRWMDPKQIIPTVNARSKADSDRLGAMLK